MKGLPIRCDDCRALHLVPPERLGLVRTCHRCGARLAIPGKSGDDRSHRWRASGAVAETREVPVAELIARADDEGDQDERAAPEIPRHRRPRTRPHPLASPAWWLILGASLLASAIAGWFLLSRT